MREAFFNSLYEIMSQDERVVVLTSDTGAIILDDIRKDFSGRCINVGIAEQNMIGLAAGLAMCGKIVYAYAIIPFVTMRCFEQVRVDVCCQNLQVKLVGVGSGFDYSTLGPTHHGSGDIAIMRSLPEITILNPADDFSSQEFAKLAYHITGPVYIRIDRASQSSIYAGSGEIFLNGLSVLKSGKDLCIIATGSMVCIAQEIAAELSRCSIDVGVVDLYRIKPFNNELFLKEIEKSEYLVTLEEHSVIGGIGSIVSEVLSEKGKSYKFKRLGLPDTTCRQYGSRKYLLSLYDLDSAGIIEALKGWIRR